jgi:hypothetical protein
MVSRLQRLRLFVGQRGHRKIIGLVRPQLAGVDEENEPLVGIRHRVRELQLVRAGALPIAAIDIEIGQPGKGDAALGIDVQCVGVKLDRELVLPLRTPHFTEPPDVARRELADPVLYVVEHVIGAVDDSQVFARPLTHRKDVVPGFGRVGA